MKKVYHHLKKEKKLNSAEIKENQVISNVSSKPLKPHSIFLN